MSVVLNRAPAQIPAAGASDLLASYVNFASTCQASGGDVGQAHYTPEGTSTGSCDESDGPALRILTILKGFAGLDEPTQTVARNVIVADLAYLLDDNHYQNPTYNLWEDTFGQSIFARSVQLAALNQVISLGRGLGIPVPPTAQAAATWLRQQLPLHWSGGPDDYYVGVLDASRGEGDPPAPYDPSIDPVLACTYGAGVPPYDPRLLSTAAQVHAQWTEPAPAAYPVNGADATIGIGPCIGRYNGDEYSGWSLTSNTGHHHLGRLYMRVRPALLRARGRHQEWHSRTHRSSGGDVPAPDSRTVAAGLKLSHPGDHAQAGHRNPRWITSTTRVPCRRQMSDRRGRREQDDRVSRIAIVRRSEP